MAMSVEVVIAVCDYRLVDGGRGWRRLFPRTRHGEPVQRPDSDHEQLDARWPGVDLWRVDSTVPLWTRHRIPAPQSNSDHAVRHRPHWVRTATYAHSRSAVHRYIVIKFILRCVLKFADSIKFTERLYSLAWHRQRWGPRGLFSTLKTARKQTSMALALLVLASKTWSRLGLNVFTFRHL